MRELHFTTTFHGAHTPTQPEIHRPSCPIHLQTAAPDTTTNIASMRKSHTHMGEKGTRVSYDSLQHFTARTPTPPEIHQPFCPTLTACSAGRRQTSQVCGNHTCIWVNGAHACELHFTRIFHGAHTHKTRNTPTLLPHTLTSCSAEHDDKHRKVCGNHTRIWVNGARA